MSHVELHAEQLGNGYFILYDKGTGSPAYIPQKMSMLTHCTRNFLSFVVARFMHKR